MVWFSYLNIMIMTSEFTFDITNQWKKLRIGKKHLTLQWCLLPRLITSIQRARGYAPIKSAVQACAVQWFLVQPRQGLTPKGERILCFFWFWLDCHGLVQNEWRLVLPLDFSIVMYVKVVCMYTHVYNNFRKCTPSYSLSVHKVQTSKVPTRLSLLDWWSHEVFCHELWWLI